MKKSDVLRAKPHKDKLQITEKKCLFIKGNCEQVKSYANINHISSKLIKQQSFSPFVKCLWLYHEG